MKSDEVIFIQILKNDIWLSYFHSKQFWYILMQIRIYNEEINNDMEDIVLCLIKLTNRYIWKFI